MPALIDHTVISNFASVGSLGLARQDLGIGYVTRAVYGELQRGIARGYAFLKDAEAEFAHQHPYGWLHLVELDREEHAIVSRLSPSLHPGEATSLSVALRRGWEFYTDDGDARRAATFAGVPLGGTLRILLSLANKQIITLDHANDLLAGMIVRARYRSPVRDLRDL